MAGEVMGRFDRLINETAALNPELMADATRRFKARYLQQRASAKYRGVEFKLTFDEWCTWWLATGHVDERGKCRGQWVMARPNDEGPYELGNLRCQLAEENVAEGNTNRAGEYSP